MTTIKHLAKRSAFAAISVAGALLLGGTAAAQSPTATLTVTPTTDLAPEQQVDITVTGFTPTAQALLLECTVGGSCYIIGYPVIDANGNASATATVYRHMSWGEHGDYDCNTPGGGCEIIAHDTNTSQQLKQPISFR